MQMYFRRKPLHGPGSFCLQEASNLNCESKSQIEFSWSLKCILAALLVRDQGSHSRNLLVIHKFFLLEKKKVVMLLLF